MLDLLWQPSSERVAKSQLTQLGQKLQARYSSLTSLEYCDLHDWSVKHPAEFWEAVWQDTEVFASAPYTTIMSQPQLPGTRWFEGAQLNFAQNLLRPRPPESLALLCLNERGETQEWSFGQLTSAVARCAASLRAVGVQVGDRVAGVMPNLPETIVAALASISLGAIWSSCSPDFGISGIEDRLGQISPKVLFTVDGYYYNGKALDGLAKLQAVRQKLPSLQQTVVVPYLGTSFPEETGLSSWKSWLSPTPETLTFEALPFDHPIYILYSSGTTGLPKSIVHGAGGTLLQHLKEHRYHCDLRPGDRLFYFTTCGWMMWNWLISGLASGAALVLYEGSPTFPDPGHLWRMAERWGITHFGTSPKFLSVLKKEGYSPQAHHDLSALRVLLSTGSPLTDDLFDWVYGQIKSDLQLASISGGTDLISCFVLGNPNLPVYRGEIQCRGLGMDVHAFDEAGNSVIDQKGELVCTTPFPSMPVGFWNDPEGKAYHKAYFSQREGCWTHGDFIELNERGGAIIYGRSDTTLNPGGVRIGTAEIYRQVETLPEIVDSLAIGQQFEGDVRVILFVVLITGITLDEALMAKIKHTIRQGTTPRHVPAIIAEVPDIPRTLSGKKVEKAIVQIFHGEAISNLSALANPETLSAFYSLAQHYPASV